MNIIEKEKFLEANGWQRLGSRNWVKKEWLDEPERLNRAPHLCPNWYHTESLEDAVAIIKEELAIAKLKEDYASDNAMVLERLLLSATRDSAWSDARSAVRDFAKVKLYTWYLLECKDCGKKPNPDIVNEYGI